MFKRISSITLPILALFIGCEKPLEGWNKYVHSKDALKAQNVITAELLNKHISTCLLYTSPSPRDKRQSRMPSSA